MKPFSRPRGVRSWVILGPVQTSCSCPVLGHYLQGYYSVTVPGHGTTSRGSTRSPFPHMGTCLKRSATNIVTSWINFLLRIFLTTVQGTGVLEQRPF